MAASTDVVVIGAGISGLSAALLLSEQGLNVLVLEAQDRVGGRTYTARDPAYGGYTDLGGAYIGSTQSRVLRMNRRFGLELYKVFAEKKTIIDVGKLRKTYRGTVPPIFNPIVAMDLNYMQWKLNYLAKEVPAEAPWRAPRAREWDSITLQEFLNKLCWTEFSRKIGAIICRAILCAEPHEVSLLGFLWYVSSGQGLPRMMNVTNGAQERKFVGGAQQLSEAMHKVLGDRVHLESPVIRIEQQDDTLTVYTSGGDKFKARFVISAIPQAILNRVAFDPPLPPRKLQLIQRIPMGSIIKTMTFYDKPYWREKSLSGEMITDKEPIFYCVDDTKPDGRAPCLMGFILANTARRMAEMSADERRQALAAHYAERFQCPELLHPVNYVEKNWADDQYSGGCYVSNFPPGTLTQFGEEMRRPFKRVFFAGTESATYWMGYMEGAIQSGERAAREILHELGHIAASEVWQEEPAAAEWPDVPIEPQFIETVLPSVTQFLVAVGAVAVAAVAWLAGRYYHLLH